MKRAEEEKLSKMTDEEKDEYFMIKKLKTIWNRVRLQKQSFRLFLKQSRTFRLGQMCAQDLVKKHGMSE